MTSIAPFRPHDYAYDPLFIVSGEKDHYKAAMVAKLVTAKFQVCPIFVNMFSDLPHYPRKRLVLRQSRPTPTYCQVERKQTRRMLEERRGKPETLTASQVCAEQMKYIKCPIVRLPDPSMPHLHVPTFRLAAVEEAEERREVERVKARGVQTLYRESSAQTSPWQPEHKVMDSGDPEILMLDFLKWGAGLPAGVHEVLLIERARMKKAWERAFPPIVDEASLNKRKDIIEAMERDEWAFREKEIQDIQNLRLELLQQMLSEIHENSKSITEKKMEMFIKAKQKEKQKQLEKLRKKTARALRKLEMEHRGESMRYRPVNIVEEQIDHKSEWYGPLMRHGEHPKRWHQVIDERLAEYKAQLAGVEYLSTLPRWLNEATQIKSDGIKLPGTRLCIRETKWTTPILKQLHEELKNVRKSAVKRPCALRVRIIREETPPSTPETEGILEEEEENYQATIYLQSVIRGRASQMLIYEGRDRCRELIAELRTTHALKQEEKKLKSQKRNEITRLQKEENSFQDRVNVLKQHLDKLQGVMVGSLLGFLNKELQRLMDERKAHAMCLLNERERQHAEAAEAGRRQKEIRRRREHDEMFRQVVKINQDTVDLYLQDIVTEGLDFASEIEAEEYVKSMAEKIEESVNSVESRNMPVDEQEEMIADLVHHFVLPEVQKQIIRKKIKDRQHDHLKIVHQSFFRKIETLPIDISADHVTSQISSCINPEVRLEYSPVEYNMEEKRKIRKSKGKISALNDTDNSKYISDISPEFKRQLPTDLHNLEVDHMHTSTPKSSKHSNTTIVDTGPDSLDQSDILLRDMVLAKKESNKNFKEYEEFQKRSRVFLASQIEIQKPDAVELVQSDVEAKEEIVLTTVDLPPITAEQVKKDETTVQAEEDINLESDDEVI